LVAGIHSIIEGNTSNLNVKQVEQLHSNFNIEQAQSNIEQANPNIEQVESNPEQVESNPKQANPNIEQVESNTEQSHHNLHIKQPHPNLHTEQPHPNPLLSGEGIIGRQNDDDELISNVIVNYKNVPAYIKDLSKKLRKL
jgi:hypothetical protein